MSKRKWKNTYLCLDTGSLELNHILPKCKICEMDLKNKRPETYGHDNRSIVVKEYMKKIVLVLPHLHTRKEEKKDQEHALGTHRLGEEDNDVPRAYGVHQWSNPRISG